MCSRARGRRGAERGGGLAELVEHAAPQSFETAALGRRQVLGQREHGDVLQRAGEPLQLGLDVARPGRQGPALRGVGTQQPERVAQQLGPVGLVGRAPGVHQRERVALREPVALEGAEHAILLVTRQSGQLVC